jgi:hypothetical protein
VKKYDAQNERIKRRYFTFLKEARRFSESSLDGVAEAIHRFESYTRFRDFRRFHIQLATLVVSNEPRGEKIGKLVQMQPDFNNRGAIRSIFDGRYRFSRYFSPIQFNRPTTYEALVANNDLEVYDLQEDPEETRNLAQDGTAKGELITALNEKLDARIEEEVGVDDGRFLPLIHGYWYPARA